MSDPGPPSAITRAFEARTLDAARFHHAEHVRVAFDLLGKLDFIEAAAAYAAGIRAIATKAGAPQKFNLTITCAFLSLIAERMAVRPQGSFEAFVGANPDLMSRAALAGRYDDERLHSDLARRVFLLP